MRIVSAALLAASLTTGCSSIWEMKYGNDKPQITYVRQSDGQNTGDLYVWHPYSNAAYMSQDGATCIKTADAARIQASATAAGLAADALGSKVTGLEANYSTQLSQAAMLLANQDAKGTFLSVALFNLCMMSLDKKIISEATLGREAQFRLLSCSSRSKRG